jgi:hypothetical protein
MRACFLAITLALLAQPLAAAAQPLSEQAAIFRAAGFTKHGAQWRSGNCEPPEASYTPGAIETYKDLNGDGRPEAVVTEGGGICYGMAGQNFWLLSKEANGAWKVFTESAGLPEFLRTTGVAGYPDILIGGPGFCFPVQRWNGRTYAVQRHEYEGKRCQPGG